ncbi:GGDEF domain-containing protein [Patescibacteria group bacterium]|nr:GGDEF domain-containing protein [Patescibacteria group bacterium]
MSTLIEIEQEEEKEILALLHEADFTDADAENAIIDLIRQRLLKQGIGEAEAERVAAANYALLKELEVRSRQIEHRTRKLEKDYLSNFLVDSVLAEEAEKVDRSGGEYAVVCLDINFLKIANDYCGGHEAGNRYIKIVAQAMSEAIDGRPILAGRTRGDEFTLIIPEMSQDDLERLNRQIEERVERYTIEDLVTPSVKKPLPSRFRGEKLRVSIGFAFRRDVQYGGWDAVKSLADERCYAEKRRFYDEPGHKKFNLRHTKLQ